MPRHGPPPAVPDAEKWLGALGRESQAMRRVTSIIRRAAPTSVPILISGETGTGKRFLARTIHELSPRHSQPFVLLDSSKTRGVRSANSVRFSILNRPIKPHGWLERFVERAKRGTLVIVETSEMNTELQAQLLPILDERERRPPFDKTHASLDIRVLALSSVPWEKTVSEGVLLKELYYRLKVFSIELPPLRKRLEDLSFLAEWFIRHFAQRTQTLPRLVDSECLDALRAYPWPGNVTELRGVIQAALIRSHGPRLILGDLPPEIATWKRGTRI